MRRQDAVPRARRPCSSDSTVSARQRSSRSVKCSVGVNQATLLRRGRHSYHPYLRCDQHRQRGPELLRQQRDRAESGSSNSSYVAARAASYRTAAHRQIQRHRNSLMKARLECQSKTVTVPRADKYVFESWAKCEEYLHQYWKETFQLFSTRSTTSPNKRNRQIAANPSSTSALIPDTLMAYNKTYNSTHSGSARKWAGRRINCKAKITACAKLLAPGVWQVHITRQCVQHNHPVGAEYYKLYHEVRRVQDEAVLADVEKLRKAGSNRKRILEYILEHSSAEPTMKDVHNLIARLEKKAHSADALEERIVDYLKVFSKDGNIAKVFLTDGVGEVIRLQTAHMRAVFQHFPEVLLIDATHDTNKSNYKLFSFTVHDAYGKGQHVQHSLTENKRKETLRVAIQQFKEANPNFNSIACIMVDKDFTEIAVLEEEFPAARILLCRFHVVQCLHCEVAKAEYNFDEWTKNELKQLSRLLVSASTQSMFDKVLDTMRAVIRCSKKREQWFAMLDSNWLSCVSMWSSVYRGNIPHMGNHTNNRLESSWQKLKTLVNRSTALGDCVVTLMFWQAVNERDWRSKLCRIGVRVNTNYDDEMRASAQKLSPHAMDLLKQQYDFGVKASTRYRYYPLGLYVFIQYDPADAAAEGIPDEYARNPISWTCSFVFHVTHRLPCRHIVYYRRMTNQKPLLPESIIDKRWILENFYLIATTPVDEIDTAFEIATVAPTMPPRAKSESEKYNELLSVAKQIADVAAQWGTRGHSTVVQKQLQFLRFLKAGSCPDVAANLTRTSRLCLSENGNELEQCVPNAKDSTHVIALGGLSSDQTERLEIAPTESLCGTLVIANGEVEDYALNSEYVNVGAEDIDTGASTMEKGANCRVDNERGMRGYSMNRNHDASTSDNLEDQLEFSSTSTTIGEFLDEYSSSADESAECESEDSEIVHFRVDPSDSSSGDEPMKETPRKKVIDFRRHVDSQIIGRQSGSQISTRSLHTSSNRHNVSPAFKIATTAKRPGASAKNRAQRKSATRQAINETLKRVQAVARVKR